ncbi:eukaryotic translation initiation factor 2-alpha kinase 1-like [Planoprotostelium fungivorum]|uniref:non-specific serine/threonine protein kinase n=1 Tax=Planoprotostelium fungivorum TaxID=1890364 RepID=A0A2P6P0X4_9EUKA|nr:eukaryotic translation initiation factor 2-alpha kinase 1-like [Planoprotostelium fungivorum]
MSFVATLSIQQSDIIPASNERPSLFLSSPFLVKHSAKSSPIDTPHRSPRLFFQRKERDVQADVQRNLPKSDSSSSLQGSSSPLLAPPPTPIISPSSDFGLPIFGDSDSDSFYESPNHHLNSSRVKNASGSLTDDELNPTQEDPDSDVSEDEWDVGMALGFDEEVSSSPTLSSDSIDQIKNSMEMFEEELYQVTGLRRSNGIADTADVTVPRIIHPRITWKVQADGGLSTEQIDYFQGTNSISPPELTITDRLIHIFYEQRMTFCHLLMEHFNQHASSPTHFPTFLRGLSTLGLFCDIFFHFSGAEQVYNAKEFVYACQHEMLTRLAPLRKSINLSLYRACQCLLEGQDLNRQERKNLSIIVQILSSGAQVAPSIGPNEVNGDVTLQCAYPSIFSKEFIQLEHIGKGGFGRVIKVIHKTDGKQYALKLIRFDSADQSTTQQVLREVKTLSSLSHPNVCRFYNAWIESSQYIDNVYNTPARGLVFPEDEISLGDQNNISGSSSIIFEQTSRCDSGECSFRSLSSLGSGSDGLTCQSRLTSVDGDYSMDDRITTGRMDSSDRLDDRMSTSDECSTLLRFGDYDTMQCRKSEEKPPRRFVLFIQMEFYRHNTLRAWLDHRNDSSPNRLVKPQCNVKIFRQITLGLEYIHRKGIFHRDIKPDNILISEDGEFKIGDFGLAKEFEYSMPVVERINEAIQEQLEGEHTGGVGTPSYAGPEQLAGCRYDFKSDIYSLGIILFELYTVFHTYAERSKVLSQLRSQIVPAELQRMFPLECSLILQMTSANVRERPTAQELLFHPLLTTQCKQEENLLIESEENLEAQKVCMKELERRLMELQLADSKTCL